MKVLELYNGVKWGKDFIEFGFDVTSIRLELFDYSIYPRGSFDLIFININKTNLDSSDDEVVDMEFGLDVITYYDKYNWIVVNTNPKVWDDIITWGLPYQDINVMRGGKLIKHRVFNSIHKWRPNPNKVYIKNTYIILELLQQI